MGGFRTKPPNDSYWVPFCVTFIVGHSHILTKEEVQSILISYPCIKVAVIDMEPQSEVGQDLGIFIDLFHSKCQGKDMLVVLCHCAERRDTLYVRRMVYIS